MKTRYDTFQSQAQFKTILREIEMFSLSSLLFPASVCKLMINQKCNYLSGFFFLLTETVRGSRLSRVIVGTFNKMNQYI